MSHGLKERNALFLHTSDEERYNGGCASQLSVLNKSQKNLMNTFLIL